MTDYATAIIRITHACDVRLCGQRRAVIRLAVSRFRAQDPSQIRKVYVFSAARPLRYLAFLRQPSGRADRWTVAFDTERIATNPTAPSSRRRAL